MARVKILLADDHTLFSDLLRGLLEPEYKVVGSVSDGHDQDNNVRVQAKNGIDSILSICRCTEVLKLLFQLVAKFGKQCPIVISQKYPCWGD